MSTESVGAIFSARFEQLKQNKDQALKSSGIEIYQPKPQPIIIRPAACSWEELEKKLQKVVNLPGLWITIRKLYEQGYGAELETVAEIALETAKKSPYNLFTASVSKKSGNWETRTLKIVHDTWEVRRNAVAVVERLKLKTDSIKAILALAWRLKGTIIRFLGIATEQGTGIRNPAGVFFALTKKLPNPA